MQGFNMGRYIPPHLEGTTTFNRASGKTAQPRNPDGSQTVRFECPFAIWCTTCHPETIIAQGVRFNAHKKKVGAYLSTPIWSFRIKHTVCGGWIEVRTDPKNTEYVVVEGGRRRDLGGDRGEDGEIVREEQVHVDGTAGDIEGVLGKLERKREGETAAEREKMRVEELKRRSERDWGDPYEVNKRVRREFRVGRRRRQDDERTGEGLKERFGLGVDVLAPVEADGERARLVEFGGDDEKNGVSKGLFEVPEAGVYKQSENGRAKGVKKVDIVAEKKAALRNGLQSHTRVKMDPFWKDAPWEKPTKRRRDDEIVPDPKNNKDTDESNVIMKATLVAYDSD